MTTIIKTKEYMTVQEAAEYTGISRSQLAKLRYNGRGCTYIRIGDSPTKAIIRYRKTDLDKWLEQNLIQTTGGL
ncbi:MAG: helix-turn-helix domain-containing protein [Lentisphaeria bacterium]|nr:helix-turn-helix domain-containing protein [Lentisphaeria bacterium]